MAADPWARGRGSRRGREMRRTTRERGRHMTCRHRPRAHTSERRPCSPGGGPRPTAARWQRIPMASSRNERQRTVARRMPIELWSAGRKRPVRRERPSNVDDVCHDQSRQACLPSCLRAHRLNTNSQRMPRVKVTHAHDEAALSRAGHLTATVGGARARGDCMARWHGSHAGMGTGRQSVIWPTRASVASWLAVSRRRWQGPASSPSTPAPAAALCC